MSKIIIFGSAEIAELANFYFSNDSAFEVIAFTVDDKYINDGFFCKKPVIPFSELKKKYSPNDYSMHVALSYNKLNLLREEKYFQVKKHGYKLVNYISSKATYWPELIIGDNCFILENQNLQPNITLGNNIMMWSGNHVGHGSSISDHAYISSHVVIAGNCSIGQRCFLGINSTVKDFVKIEDDSFIGMGANVTQDLSEGSVVLNSSSTILDRDDRKAKFIKKKYFGF